MKVEELRNNGYIYFEKQLSNGNRIYFVGLSNRHGIKENTYIGNFYEVILLPKTSAEFANALDNCILLKTICVLISELHELDLKDDSICLENGNKITFIETNETKRSQIHELLIYNKQWRETIKKFSEQDISNKLTDLRQRLEGLESEFKRKKLIQDKMAVLKALIDKSLDIKNQSDFNKYSRRYNELENKINK